MESFFFFFLLNIALSQTTPSKDFDQKTNTHPCKNYFSSKCTSPGFSYFFSFKLIKPQIFQYKLITSVRHSITVQHILVVLVVPQSSNTAAQC